MPEPAAHASRILLVDDDVQLVRGLKTALEHFGYLVRAVEQPGKAVEAATQFLPHLILLDVMMPGVDGWEVLARLRGNYLTDTVPVIMLTASNTSSAKVRGFSLGADDYVTKPFSLEELRCRIDAVLRRAKPQTGPEPEAPSLTVIAGGSGYEFIKAPDVYFVEGIRNYTYVHTYDARHLSRLSLGGVNDLGLDGFMRVHRSFIVNMSHVKACRWVTKSSYSLRLGDLAGTEVPVSRAMIPEVQRRLGMRR